MIEGGILPGNPVNRVRESLSNLSAKVSGGTPKVNTGGTEGMDETKKTNPPEREQLDTLPFSGASIKVSDSHSAASGGPDERGPCTRNYETDPRSTHRTPADESRWDVYHNNHAPGQNHD